jgi:hypothetical protein
MAEFELYDYVARDGTNAFKAWTKTLQKDELAKLNQKLDMLRREPELPPLLLAGPLERKPIYKLRINGRVALRPMLCKGPIDNDSEFTLLMGATERDRVLDPEDAVDQAADRRAEVIANPTRRRTPHERVTWGANERPEAER